MNQGADKNRNLFWKEVGKVKRGKEENYNKIKEGNGRLAIRKDEEQRTRKNYLRVCVLGILRSRIQSSCVALVVLREVIIF